MPFFYDQLKLHRRRSMAAGYAMTALVGVLVVQSGSAQTITKSQANTGNSLSTQLDTAEFRDLKDAVKAQNAGVLSRIQQSDTVKEVFNDLRYGKHLVRNAERGEIIIAAAINLQRGIDVSKNLAVIRDYARRDYAEAQNILGFYHEYGLNNFSRDIARAKEFYSASAQSGYAAARLNLALLALYGKENGTSNPRNALLELARANAHEMDSSGRVCGLGAFIANRIDKAQVTTFAARCSSRLAKMAAATVRTDLTLSERIDDLKGAYALGVIDGLYAILEITSKINSPEALTQNCRYRQVIDALQHKPLPVQICNADPSTKAFVMMEVQALERQRQSPGIHLSWAVPYLPFSVIDETYFANAIKQKEGTP